MNQKLKNDVLVKFLALGKAKAAAKKYPNAFIISADTVVSFKGKAIGKPKNSAQAKQMLTSFSDSSHYVITGTVVMNAKTKKFLTTSEKIKITFKKLSPEIIKSYIESGEPFDKAGGYNLQGSGFNLIKEIKGDFSNGLGLSMSFVFNALNKLGAKI